MFKFFGKRNLAAIAALVVAAVAGVGAYAFTASNTVTAESAGAGTATVSGYTATKISYTFSPDTSTIDGVSFDLDAVASDVKVAVVGQSGTVALGDYQDCGTAAVGNNPDDLTAIGVTCTFSPKLLNAEDQNLYIAAVTSGVVSIG